MTVLLTLDIPVKLTGGFPEAEIDVRITPQWDGPFDPNVYDPEVYDVGWDYATQAQLAIDLDASLAEAARPRTSRRQIIPPWRLTVGSVEVPWYRLLPGVSVTETLDGLTQFGFSVPRRGSGADKFTEPLGSPRSWLGVPGGGGAVSIAAEFLTSAGRKSVPLVTGGVLDNSSGTFGDAGDVRTFNGGGAHGRYDRSLVTYQAPPGHGQTSGTVVRRLLELAGIPAAKIAISGGRRLYKAIEVVDRAPIEVCNAILEPELKRVYHDDRDDTWKLLAYGGIDGLRVESVIRESDVLSGLGTFGDAAAADAPTSVVLTGTAQVTREECGLRTEYQVIETFGFREIRGARYTQNISTGALSPVSSPFWFGEESALRLIRRQVSVQEIDCETVVARETAVWEWFAPEYAKFHRDSAGVIDQYVTPGGLSSGGYIYDSGATAGDSTPLYLWPRERFTVTEWQREELPFDDRGYGVGSVVKKGGWRFLEVPIKTRGNTGTTFESEPLHAAWVTADGRCVKHGSTSTSPISELWYGTRLFYDEVDVGDGMALRRVGASLIVDFGTDYAERIDNTTAVNDSGFVTQESGAISRYFARPRRGLYLYDGGESDQATQTLQEAESEITVYAGAGEGNHDEYRSRYDFDGALIESEESTGLQGYLPAAEQRSDILPPTETYDDPAEAEFALAASRHESRPIKVRVGAPALEAVLVEWEQKGRTVEFAENEDDLAAVGAYTIRQASSIGVSFPLPFNPLIRPGQRHVLSLPSLGVHYDLLIESVAHHQEDRTWTQVVGRHDVV